MNRLQLELSLAAALGFQASAGLRGNELSIMYVKSPPNQRTGYPTPIGIMALMTKEVRT